MDPDFPSPISSMGFFHLPGSDPRRMIPDSAGVLTANHLLHRRPRTSQTRCTSSSSSSAALFEELRAGRDRPAANISDDHSSAGRYTIRAGWPAVPGRPRRHSSCCSPLCASGSAGSSGAVGPPSERIDQFSKPPVLIICPEARLLSCGKDLGGGPIPLDFERGQTVAVDAAEPDNACVIRRMPPRGRRAIRRATGLSRWHQCAPFDRVNATASMLSRTALSVSCNTMWLVRSAGRPRHELDRLASGGCGRTCSGSPPASAAG